jgi:hypothetical protein
MQDFTLQDQLEHVLSFVLAQVCGLKKGLAKPGGDEKNVSLQFNRNKKHTYITIEHG